ncbi:hypothetical protein GCM10027271_46580 [Saccharopolyspora gloriosae]|uniref:Uncharacterized protein n=1 Tax=Saccharopolyspora gloriosae TaxID=455344 RepID=A0A840NR54_9PSEU|nr:hypothetical protein [Saccharopolyspora gloriosae]MBB5071739.1 hypothetical protein [Saccharopolyspora gloriosae]
MSTGTSSTVRRTKQLPPYRAVFAVDTKDFSNSPSAHQEQLSQDIPALLEKALASCELSRLWDQRVFGTSTGDGYYFGVDATDVPFLVDPFLTELDEVLQEHDEEVRRRDRDLRLRLRASIHLGPIPDSGLSTAMNETHRLLDSAPVRKILDESDPDSTFLAAILSERVFTDVIRGAYVKLRPARFAERAVKVKSYEDVGYLYTPTASINPDRLDGVDAAPVDAAQLQKDQQKAPEPPAQSSVTNTVHNTVHNEFSGSSSGSVLQVGQARDINGFNGQS